MSSAKKHGHNAFYALMLCFQDQPLNLVGADEQLPFLV